MRTMVLLRLYTRFIFLDNFCLLKSIGRAQVPAAVASRARLPWPCALLAFGFCFFICGKQP